jgi:hypothetical protein
VGITPSKSRAKTSHDWWMPAICVASCNRREFARANELDPNSSTDTIENTMAMQTATMITSRMVTHRR